MTVVNSDCASWLRVSTLGVLAATLLLGFGSLDSPGRKEFIAGVRAHDQGRRTHDRQDWEECAQLMGQAHALEPENGQPVLIDGKHREPYLPLYFLGLARYNQENCTAALAAWTTSLGLGFVQTTRKFGELEPLLAACREKLPGHPQRSALPALRSRQPRPPSPIARTERPGDRREEPAR